MKLALDNRRAVEEWVGKTPDTEIPRRVKARVFARYEGKCAITGIKLRLGDTDFDHIKSLRNGGRHCESNLQPVYRPAHREKTAVENSDGAKADRIYAKHNGLWPETKAKLRGRSFDRTRPIQRVSEPEVVGEATHPEQHRRNPK